MGIMTLTAPIERWIAFKLPLRSYITLLILASFVSADGIVSLNSLPAFTSQRTCAQSCFYSSSYNNVGVYLACAPPVLDSCMCRTDLISIALDYISNCVYYDCTRNSVDINSALSIYSSYCAKANSPASNNATTTPANISTPVVETSGGSPITPTLTATIINTHTISSTWTPTPTTAPTPAPTPASSTSVAAIVGIVMGGIIVLVIIGAIIFFLMRRKPTPPQTQQQHTDRYVQPSEPAAPGLMPFSSPPPAYSPSSPSHIVVKTGSTEYEMVPYPLASPPGPFPEDLVGH